MKSVVSMFVLGLCASAAQASESHCTASETTVFTCKAGKQKVISVCAAGQDVQYRFGRVGSADMTLPKTPAERATVSRGNIMLAGGGGAYIRFVNGKTEYIVYSASNKSVDKAGVSVEKDGKRLANVACTTAGEVDAGSVADSVAEDTKEFDLP